MKYKSVKTPFKHEALTDQLKGKVVAQVNYVNCDQGFVLIFTDGTTLETGYSGGYGETAFNKEVVDDNGTSDSSYTYHEGYTIAIDDSLRYTIYEGRQYKACSLIGYGSFLDAVNAAKKHIDKLIKSER